MSYTITTEKTLMQYYWQSPPLDQQQDAKERILQILAPAPGGKLKREGGLGALGCSDWGGFGLFPLAGKNRNPAWVFFSSVGRARCPSLPRVHVASPSSPRTEARIVPCRSPVPVPSNDNSPSPTRPHFQELYTLHGWSGWHSPPLAGE